MTREAYLAQRETLMSEAQAALDNDELDVFDNKTKAVEDLDAKYEESEKRRANLNALNKVSAVPQAVNLMNAGKAALTGTA